MTRILTVPEAAEELRVSKASLDRLIAAGKIQSFKVGRRRLVPDFAIDEYARANIEGDGAWQEAGDRVINAEMVAGLRSRA